MEATELPSGEISGTVLLYNNPEPLSIELHGKLGVKQLELPFAFAATTGLVKDHHFDLVFDAFFGDETVRDFLRDANPDALRETAARLTEAIERSLWRPKSNSAGALLAELKNEGIK